MDRSGGKRRGYTVGLAIYQDATNEEASHPSADSTHHPIVKVQEMASVVQDLHAGTTLVGGSGPLPIQKVSPLDTVPVVPSLTNVNSRKQDVP